MDPSAVMSSGMPWGAAIGAVAQVASAPPAGPSSAKSAGSAGVNLDNSGWTVTYGDNAGVDSTRTQSAPSVSAMGGSLSESGPGLGGAVGGALGGALGGVNMQLVLLAVCALVLVKTLKRKQA